MLCINKKNLKSFPLIPSYSEKINCYKSCQVGTQGLAPGRYFFLTISVLFTEKSHVIFS
jgi:hypothetical protein